MNNLHSKEILEDVATQLQFSSPAYVEKDCYLTHALHAISTIDNENFKLIFAGGTCLAKAYRIIGRMSEDIDFKITLSDLMLHANKSLLRKKISEFKQEIFNALANFGFIVHPEKIRSRDNNSYTNIVLDHSSFFENTVSLRPHLMLEFTLSKLRIAPIILPVQSFVHDVLNGFNSEKSKELACVSLVETAAEKWVAVTRRIAAIERGHDTTDETLVRHLYDLYAINKKINLSEEFFNLVYETIERDRIKFKRHHEYIENPISEITFTLEFLNKNSVWSQYFNDFVLAMTYDKKVVSYNECYMNLKNITDRILRSEKNE